MNKSQKQASGKKIPTKTGNQQKKWNQFQTKVLNNQMKGLSNILPTIPGKANQGAKTKAQVYIRTQGKKKLWTPLHTIEALGGPANSRQQEKTPHKKFEMDRSNLRVVEGTPSTIQLNLDKSKGIMVEKAKISPKLAETTEAAKPPLQQARPLPPATGQAIPSIQKLNPGVQGRMTASSFMKAKHQPPIKPLMSTPVQFCGNPVSGLGLPRGIPRSFLVQQQMEQQQLHQQQPNPQMYANPQGGFNSPSQAKPRSQGPVWEATVRQPPRNTWTAVQSGPTFDQSGQTFDQSGQTFDHSGQTFNQSGQTFSQSGPTFDQRGLTFDQSGQTFGQSGQTFDQSGHTFDQSGQTFGQSGQTFGHGSQPFGQSQEKMFVPGDNSGEPPRQYSPSDNYQEISAHEAVEEDELDESPDGQQPGLKRLSAFKRLGPLTQPKKPKLTINLLINKEQAVREVVDQSDNPDSEKYIPAHLKPDIQTSIDDTVMKYLVFWPWKKTLHLRRTVTARQSKSVMLMELEQMEEAYGRDTAFFQVSVKGYPASWSKEDVLDTVLESVKGKSFIPCFIEFSRNECKFLVIRSKAALVAIHKYGFITLNNEVELTLSISVITLSVNQIDFIPRLILRKRLSLAMEGETEINLTEFTTKSDLSHFIYFPLNRVANQSELLNLQSSVPWESLTKLVLSHNRITTLSGFDLPQHTPRLKHLDLSHNYIEAVTALLPCRDLPLNCISLEGNPLCTDYIEQDRYIKVLKMMFSGLREIDGVRLEIGNDFPETKRNYSPPDAAHVVSKVLEVLFPLLDASPDERHLCEELYDVNAMVTVTFMYKLRYSPIYKDYRALFSHARVMDEGDMESIVGATEIAKVISRWPPLQHDPLTFTVDVMYHSDTTTILRVAGILKVTAETLAEDEHLLAFTRTIVLHSLDSVEYKITNEMIYWDTPDQDRARDAFRMATNAVRSKNISLKLEGTPDEALKENLLKIFMKLTEMDRKPSEKCLELKNWHLKDALEYFSKLLKLDNLQPLYL